MNATLIADTFAYFAKYPLLAGVLKNFVKNSSPYFTGYDTLKQTATNLTPNSIIPGITDYVFGVDENIVKNRIEQINGIYLFVDYGNLNSSLTEPQKTEVGELIIAVTVARKTPPNDLDSIESILLADKTLEYITTIKDTMKHESQRSIFLKNMVFPVDISPWFARELFNSCGWTMSFRKRGVHLI